MPDNEHKLKKRRKITATACLAALVFLAMHSRCTSLSTMGSNKQNPAETKKSRTVATVSSKPAKPSAKTETLPEKKAAPEKAEEPKSEKEPTETLPEKKAAPEKAEEPKSEKEPPASSLDALPKAPRKNVERVLLLGVDGAGKARGRTDAIVVAVFDYAAKRIGVISIPRDLHVDIPGIGQNRINTVYRVGSKLFGGKKAAALLRSVIQQNLGISVDYTLLSDFKGFVSAVDALGGISVNVRCPIEDCFWLGEETCTPLSLAAGRQHLDGKTALLFIRSRHGRSDIDRGRRQQAVLMGLKRQLARPASLLRLPRLFLKLSPYVKTDLTLDAVLRMGNLAKEAGGNVHGLVMRPPIVEEKITDDKKSVLVLNTDRWKLASTKLFVAAAPGARSKQTCPIPDAGINWRKNRRKNKPKQQVLPPDKADN